MPITSTEPTLEAVPTPTPEYFRPLYIRRVPEQVWILVHDNANRSRMRLQDYVVEVLKNCQQLDR